MARLKKSGELERRGLHKIEYPIDHLLAGEPQ